MGENNSLTIGILIAVIGGLLLIIFGAPIKDIMDSPEAIFVAQSNEKSCPQNINFQSYGSKTAFILVKLQNVGDDGSLFVTIDSNKLLSRTNDEEEFKFNATKSWFMNNKQYQDFKFELKQGENIENLNENVSISFTSGCYEKVLGKYFYCKPSIRCCNYQKEKSKSGYKLLNQICS